MSDIDNYYNNFYSELAKIDAKGNNFSKIKDFVPQLKSGSLILDVGCGYGTVSVELIKQGHRVYGMEINKEAVAELKKKGFVVFEDDITKPFHLNQTFDVVLLLDVLEHVFDPLSLFNEAAKVLAPGGSIIISVPLYFDLLDRLRILFTGSIISYDNICYGKELYKRFRSYNYDHVRFFRPKEIFEMCEILKLKEVKLEYGPVSLPYRGVRTLLKILANKTFVKWFPNLLAHSMIIVVQKQS